MEDFNAYWDFASYSTCDLVISSPVVFMIRVENFHVHITCQYMHTSCGLTQLVAAQVCVVPVLVISWSLDCYSPETN